MMKEEVPNFLSLSRSFTLFKTSFFCSIFFLTTLKFSCWKVEGAILGKNIIYSSLFSKEYLIDNLEVK